jgi:hypothetical protein
MKKLLSLFLALVLCLVSVGCSTQTSDLVTALNAVSDASSVAVVVTSSLVAMGKLDPAVGDQVSQYATAVGGAVTTSIAELNSSDPNPQKITVISAAFAKVAAPAIGSAAGANAQQVSAAIDAVSAAVKIFLGRLNSSGTLKLANAAPTAKIKLEPGDKALMKQIQKKNAETMAKAAALKTK